MFEFLDLDLKKLMDSRPNFSKDQKVVKLYMWQLLNGITYCHSRR